MTEKEKYFLWEKDAKENRGLISTSITLNEEFKNSDKYNEEDLYRELNLWNEQLDNHDIKARLFIQF